MTKHPVFYDGRVLKYIQHSEKWSLKNLKRGPSFNKSRKAAYKCHATNRGSCSRRVVLCHISQLHNPLLRLLSSLVVELPLLKIQPTQGCHDAFLILPKKQSYPKNNLTNRDQDCFPIKWYGAILSILLWLPIMLMLFRFFFITARTGCMMYMTIFHKWVGTF